MPDGPELARMATRDDGGTMNRARNKERNKTKEDDNEEEEEEVSICRAYAERFRADC